MLCPHNLPAMPRPSDAQHLESHQKVPPLKSSPPTNPFGNTMPLKCSNLENPNLETPTPLPDILPLDFLPLGGLSLGYTCPPPQQTLLSPARAHRNTASSNAMRCWTWTWPRGSRTSWPRQSRLGRVASRASTTYPSSGSWGATAWPQPPTSPPGALSCPPGEYRGLGSCRGLRTESGGAGALAPRLPACPLWMWTEGSGCPNRHCEGK